MRFKTCEICGNEFETNSPIAKYCSVRCRRTSINKSFKEERNASSRAVRKYNWGDIYDNRCAVCGWRLIEDEIVPRINGKFFHQNGNDIHHIIPISDGGKDELENLIMLCPNHHRMADVGLISKETLFSLIPSEEDIMKLQAHRKEQAMAQATAYLRSLGLCYEV